MVKWQNLRRLMHEGEVRGYVSLEDGDSRLAFLLPDDAPVVKVAKAYFQTFDACKAMTPQAFHAYYDKWQGKAEDLQARDPEKADAFYSALRAAFAWHKRKVNLGEDATLRYLFEEQEAP